MQIFERIRYFREPFLVNTWSVFSPIRIKSIFICYFLQWKERKILSHLIHWRLISIVVHFMIYYIYIDFPLFWGPQCLLLLLINVSIFKLVSPQILKEKQKVILFFTFLLWSRIISPTNSFLHCSGKLLLGWLTKIKGQQKTNISHFFDNHSCLCHSVLALGRALIESATTNLATHTLTHPPFLFSYLHVMIVPVEPSRSHSMLQSFSKNWNTLVAML